MIWLKMLDGRIPSASISPISRHAFENRHDQRIDEAEGQREEDHDDPDEDEAVHHAHHRPEILVERHPWQYFVVCIDGRADRGQQWINDAVVIAGDRNLADVVTDAQHLLHDASARECIGLLLGFQTGLVEPDDAKSTIGQLVVGILAHQDDALANLRLELFGKFAPQYDAAVVRTFERSPFGYLAADSFDRCLLTRIHAEQDDATRFAFARHDGRNADSRGIPLDARLRESALDLPRSHADAIADARVVPVVGMVHLDVTRQFPDPVAQHFIDHAAHQRCHEDHRPCADADRRQHDDRTPVIAPEVAPGQGRNNLQVMHLAAC